MTGPGWIVTAAGIRTYMDEVNRYVDALHAAVVGGVAKIPPPTLAAWVRFLTDWKVFYGTNRPGEHGILGVWGSVADSTERYETDTTQWRKVLAGFIDLGAAVIFDPDKKPGGPSLPSGDSIPWLAIGVAALAAAVIFRK
jgi:hypothetical protein